MNAEQYRRDCEDAASLGSLAARAECVRQGWWPGIVIINATGDVPTYQGKPLVFEPGERERAEMILFLLQRNAEGSFSIRESSSEV